MLQLIFVFSLFLGKVMYGNEFKTKEKKQKTKMDWNQEKKLQQRQQNYLTKKKTLQTLGTYRDFLHLITPF